MGYNDIPRFNPNYGNKYGFRQRGPGAPATGPATVPPPGSAAAPEAPAPTTGGSTRPTTDYHSGPSADQMVIKA